MRRVLLLFALLPLLPGCRTPDYTPEEEAAAREIRELAQVLQKE